MNFNNTQKKTQQSESWQQNEVCVFLFIKKVVCWLVLLAVLENLMFFLFLLPFFFWHGPCPSLEKIGANPSLQLQVDKISSSRRVFLFKRCKRLQRQENGWHFASALSWKLPKINGGCRSNSTRPFLPAFSRCFFHLSMFHHLFRSGRQHKDISKWTAETLPIPSSIQNRTVLKKPGTVQFILTQLLTRLVFTTHPGDFGFETNPGAHGGSPSKRPEQEGKKMPGPGMYIDIYIYIYI